MQTAKSLTRLGGCIGWSEFLLSAYSFYWFCHTMAHMFYIPGRVAQPGNVFGNRCESDCRSRGRPSDPGPVSYFRGDYEKNSITPIVFLFLTPPPPSSVNVICSFYLFYHTSLDTLFFMLWTAFSVHTNCLSPDQTVPYEAVGSWLLKLLMRLPV